MGFHIVKRDHCPLWKKCCLYLAAVVLALALGGDIIGFPEFKIILYIILRQLHDLHRQVLLGGPLAEHVRLDAVPVHADMRLIPEIPGTALLGPAGFRIAPRSSWMPAQR